MTTIAEEKQRISDLIKTLASALISARKDVVEYMELGLEMLQSSAGLPLYGTDDYDLHCRYYGQQRAIVKGLAASDMASFNINVPAVWQQGHQFTLPSASQFCFVLIDENGDEIPSFNPADYYLVKRLSDDVPLGVLDDPAAYITPILQQGSQQSLGLGSADGASDSWAATTSYMVENTIIPTTPNGFFYKTVIAGITGSSEPIWPTAAGEEVEDGTVTWRCVGMVLVSWSGTSSYLVGDRVAPATPNGFFFKAVQAGITGISEPLWPSAIGDEVADGTVVWRAVGTTSLSGTLANYPVPGTLKVFHDATQIGQDDGAGNITGTNISSGSVDYNTRVVNITYSLPPVVGIQVLIQYDAIIGKDDWDATYGQVDFSLSSIIYGSSNQFVVDVAVIDSGTPLSSAPKVLDIFPLRDKITHQPVGNLIVIVEGLKMNTGWSHLIDPADEAMEVPTDEFEKLLGFMDPANADDAVLSSNPLNISSGRKEVGAGLSPWTDYPDLDKNPFFPWNDGAYSGSKPDITNFSHIEESVLKWWTIAGIKFLYETTPDIVTAVDPPVSPDPDSFIGAVTNIATFTSAATLTIPEDGVPGLDPVYLLVGNFVHHFDPDDQGRYPCRWNDVQELIEEFSGENVNHADTQADRVLALGTFLNTIDVAQQTGDLQFLIDTQDFVAAVQTLLVYHSTFNPVDTPRPTYSTVAIDALVAAAQAYLTPLMVRRVELDAVLGTSVTSAVSGSYNYVKSLYDALVLVASKEIGFGPKVLTKINSETNIRDLITQNQQNYADLP